MTAVEPIRICLIAFAALLLASCATPPDVEPDIVHALETANVDGRAGLLRHEGLEVTGVPFVTGNDVALLRDGPHTYAAMMAALQSAKHQIDMESYEFEADQEPRFTQMLLAKRQQGVEVNLIYDAWGSNTDPKLFTMLRQYGVRVVEFHPIDLGHDLPDTLNHRDHRKLLVVDGKIAFTGGINLSSVYERPRLRFPELGNVDHLPWRDTDIRIEGPVTANFVSLFAATWNGQHGPPLSPAPAPEPAMPANYSVQALGGAPTKGQPLVYKTLMVTIALARHSIHLTTGFFVPPPPMIEELERAARRGVEIAIIVPSRSDSRASINAGRSYYTALLKAGVKIYEYQNAVLHAKTAVIDGDWSTVGSSNLDWRSAVLNNEINAVILGQGFGSQMDAMFQADLKSAKAIDLATWSHRPLSERAEELEARVFQYFL